MKGIMEVLNLKKRVTADNKSNMLQSESLCDGVIKIEPDDELDKRNCENEDYITDLTLNDSRDEESMSNDESETMKDEVFATEMMEDEDDEVENPDLQMFSVVVKEENRSSRDSAKNNDSVRGRVEIKYEDDIEEEDYDSDDELNEHSEMSMASNTDRSSAISYVNVNGKMSNSSAAGMPFRSCLNGDYFDSSIVNFQMGSQIERNASDLNGDLQSKEDKSGDSILLSIVYATINVPFSQVSKFLAAYNLSKTQLSVIRKVRRQVKNRLYAQNCRKRRVAHIKNLANELQQIKGEKEKLCNVKNDLTMKMIDIERRYKLLYTHVMKTVTERYRNEEFDYSDIDSNMNDSSEETNTLKRKLSEENDDLKIKKRTLEEKYEQLHGHVFKVIASRHENSGMARNGAMDGNLDFKLCHMDIVNELAMLNKYWTKNNELEKSNEQMDFESSISLDGSRTSENKLNDFVDYESSISVDDSRTDENKLNDFIDYESSLDYSIQPKDQSRRRIIVDPSELVTVEDDSDNESGDEVNIVTETEPECVVAVDEPNDENSKHSENSLIIWSEDEDEDDVEDDELQEHMDELIEEKELLETRMNLVREQYEKLYEHVLKASEIDETEFLKNLLDYCIRLMKSSAAECTKDLPAPPPLTEAVADRSCELGGS